MPDHSLAAAVGSQRLLCHQPRKFGVTDVASFGKSVDQLEGSFPVVFQNEPSAFTRLGYTRPMLIFGNAISVEQHGNFAKVRKPCTIVRWTVKELFASPTGSETCGSIHVVQGPGSPKTSGASLPPSGHAESDVDGNHGHTERPRHYGMARLVTAKPALCLGHGAPPIRRVTLYPPAFRASVAVEGVKIPRQHE